MRCPSLSICIPTYNREIFLRESILGILNQINSTSRHYIEICISDNASTDGTEVLVAELKESTDIAIVYSKNDRNIGADLNFIQAVSLASGEYCWLMGSDDVAVMGSIEFLLDDIKSGCDVYLFNRIDCDINLRPLRKRWWINKNIKTTTFDLSNRSDFNRYANNANSIGALFSYLSSIVFKREKWRNIEIRPEFLGTSYIHVFVLCSFIKDGCRLKYIDSHMVYSRGDNDSFLEQGNNGIVNRIMLDINGYSMICNSIFQNSVNYSKAVLKILHAERPQFKTIAVLRLRSEDQDWPSICCKLRKAGYNAVVIWLIEIMRFLLPLTRAIFREVIYKSRLIQ